MSHPLLTALLCGLMASNAFGLMCHSCNEKIENGVIIGDKCAEHLISCNSVQDVANQGEISDVNVDKLVFFCEKEIRRIRNGDKEYDIVARNCIGDEQESFSEECKVLTKEEIEKPDFADDQEKLNGTLEKYELCACTQDGCNFAPKSGEPFSLILSLILGIIIKLLV